VNDEVERVNGQVGTIPVHRQKCDASQARKGSFQSPFEMPREEDDNRFAAMHSSHLFKRSSQAKHKVKVDDRFKEVLQDKKYVNVPGKVDKYGRKRKSRSAKEELKEFYTIDEEDGVDEKVEKVEKVEKGKKAGTHSLTY